MGRGSPPTKDMRERPWLLSKKTKQIPPLTSAIKVNGKKLYEYQRKGIDIEVKERNIKIYSSGILSDLRYIDNHYEIDIKLNVIKVGRVHKVNLL